MTQRFVRTDPLPPPPGTPAQVHGHTAPWFDPDRRLYRLFGFLNTDYQVEGVPLHRVPGKIDLNALNSREVFRALCDAQTSNYFTEAQVDQIFDWLMIQRTPNTFTFPGETVPTRIPGPNDRPFLGLATGPIATTIMPAGATPITAAPAPQPMQVASLSGSVGGMRWEIRAATRVIVGTGATRESVQVVSVDGSAMPPTFTAIFTQDHAVGTPVAPVGIEDTWLRSLDGSNRRLMEVVQPPTAPPAPQAGDHPYLRYELMRKIANNVTNRSNTFAVWLTVGFFEVISEDGNNNNALDPGEDLNGNGRLDLDLLGAEIGRDEGRHVRHRMFAIIDRSDFHTLEAASGTAVNRGGQPQVSATINLQNVEGLNPLAIGAGTPLEVDVGVNQETVIVTNVVFSGGVPTQITATFKKDHAAGFEVRAHGNPGPLPRFDPAEHPEIVRHYSIIE